MRAIHTDAATPDEPGWMAPFLASLARDDLAPATLRGYRYQINRWRTEGPSKDQTRELDRMEAQNERLRTVTADVLALASELRTGTIERIMSMSDVELGLQTLLGGRPRSRR